MVYWDADERKDLLIGLSDGLLRLYLNVGTDDAPTFDGGTLLQVGEPELKTDIDVGARATPTVVDWNNDGRRDLVVGALDGMIRFFLNEGTDTEPDYVTAQYVQASGGDLDVPSNRSSPAVCDADGDGMKDLLVGNTNGELLLYTNIGSDDAPTFGDPMYVWSAGAVLDLPGTPRSRPFVCDWTGDGLLDVLIGAGDGLVHLYEGREMPGDLNCDGGVDFFDIDAFVLAITDPAGYAELYPECLIERADINDDGSVDFFDIDPFVALITGK